MLGDNSVWARAQLAAQRHTAEMSAGGHVRSMAFHCAAVLARTRTVAETGVQEKLGASTICLTPKPQQLVPNVETYCLEPLPNDTVAFDVRPQGPASPSILHLRHCHCRFAKCLAVPQLLRRVGADVVIPARYCVRGFIDGVDQLAHQIVFGLCRAGITPNEVTLTLEASASAMLPTARSFGASEALQPWWPAGVINRAKLTVWRHLEMPVDGPPAPGPLVKVPGAHLQGADA